MRNGRINGPTKIEVRNRLLAIDGKAEYDFAKSEAALIASNEFATAVRSKKVHTTEQAAASAATRPLAHNDD